MAGKIVYLDHPLLKHKISRLRNKLTRTAEFHQIVKEVSIIIGYEAMRDLPIVMSEIETPLEKTIQPKVERKDICFVPILRAGLGMSEGLLELIPGALCGHIGIYRNEQTHLPFEYMCKLPPMISNKKVFLLDPMLATGGSAIAAVTQLKKHGVKDITFLCIIAAPEGVKAFHDAFPDIDLYVGALDRCLNDQCYICPGLGDCGDRIFGTLETEDKEI